MMGMDNHTGWIGTSTTSPKSTNLLTCDNRDGNRMGGRGGVSVTSALGGDSLKTNDKDEEKLSSLWFQRFLLCWGAMILCIIGAKNKIPYFDQQEN